MLLNSLQIWCRMSCLHSKSQVLFFKFLFHVRSDFPFQRSSFAPSSSSMVTPSFLPRSFLPRLLLVFPPPSTVQTLQEAPRVILRRVRVLSRIVILLILLLVLSIFSPRNFLEQRRQKGAGIEGRNESGEKGGAKMQEGMNDCARAKERWGTKEGRSDGVRREGTNLERKEEANVERGRDDYVRRKEPLIETEETY